MPLAPPDPATLAAGVLAGDRAMLGRALTLAESSRPADRPRARALLAALGRSGTDALRIGITGPPGAGKSSLLEALGTRLADAGRKVAVYAVDPSSPRTGGSILGDKTRMARLSAHPGAFVRPAPSGASTGGVALRTAEAVAVLAAAGHDPVFIETVGVGQNETLVRDVVDLLVLAQSPVAGDDLQSIKRGTLELADAVIVTMADGDLAPRAARARALWQASLGHARPALAVSAHAGTGLDEAWATLVALADAMRADGRLAARREAQRVAAFEHAAMEGLRLRFLADPEASRRRQVALAALRRGETTPGEAADLWLGDSQQRAGG